MKSSAARTATTAVLVAMLVLIASSDVDPGLAADSLLQVQQVKVNGKTVRVTIVNHGDEAAAGTVVVQAIAAGRMVQASRSVTLAAGESDTVALDFNATVKGIIQTGVILDDGAPF